MESPSEKVIVLKVSSVCCRAYKKTLKEKLLKLAGVFKVSIDIENDKVSVIGRVDSKLLMKTIEKTGKYAEIIHFSRSYTSSKSNAYEEFKTYRNESGKCPHDATRNRAQQCREPCNNDHRVENDHEEHKCESYIPQEIDAMICRDFWCKEHKQRAIFHDKVPASSSTGIFGHPFHSSGAPFHFSNNPWEQYGRHPGYNRRPPPTAYGFGSGGYMPGSSGFYDYGF